MEPQVRGICFDLDDTLIVYAPAVQTALRRTAAHPALRDAGVTPQALVEAVTGAYERLYGYPGAGFDTLGELPVSDLHQRLTHAALKQLGIALHLTDTLSARYQQEEALEVVPVPAACAVLARLRSRFKLGVITNGPARLQRQKLEQHGLSEYMDAVVIDTEFGCPKPDPRIFAHAASRLGLKPCELMFVGNSPEADIAGANAAGWISVLYSKTHTEASAQPHYRITELTELFALPPVALEDKTTIHAGGDTPRR